MTVTVNKACTDSKTGIRPLKKSCSFRISSPAVQWDSIPHHRAIERHDTATCLLENDEQATAVVVAGGSSSDDMALCAVESYDIIRREWSTLPSLSTPRSGCSIVSLDNRIYLIGGVDAQNQRVKSVEVLDLTSSETSWTQESSMISSRWFGAAVSFPLHGDIIVLGGRDHQWQELKTVQSFDTETKEWLDIASMCTPRFGCGATRIGPSKLIAVGGFDGETWQTSAEIYDYEADEWTMVQSMPESLEFCSATKLGVNHVLVSGKPSKSDKFKKFYCYNIAQDTWSSVKPSYKFHGTPIPISYESQVMVIDESKHSYLSSNLLTVVNDDLTENSSQSSCSNHDEPVYVPPDHSTTTSVGTTGEDDGSIPWWTAEGRAMTSLKCSTISKEIDIGDDDQSDLVSVLEDSVLPDDASACGRSTTSSKVSNGSGNRSRPRKVENLETTDSFGQKVLYTGSVSRSHHRPHGRGKWTWLDSGNTYTGTFRHGRMDGYGHLEYSNGDSFEGIFSKDRRNGRGVFRVQRDGRTVDCNYKDDLPDDPKGTMEWKDGTIYVGSFVNGKRTGKAVQRFPSGVKYQGDFVSGKYHGYGICEFADGSIYKGEWNRGQAHGQGRLTSADGEVLYDGQWENDGPAIGE